MLYDCNRISYWTDRRLAGLAGPDYDATISFGLPLEAEDSQYGKSRIYIPFVSASCMIDAYTKQLRYAQVSSWIQQSYMRGQSLWLEVRAMRRKVLTAGEVSEMRRLFDAGHRISDLSKRYRVHRAVVSRIVHRQTHTEVPDVLEPLDVTRPVGRRGRGVARQAGGLL